MAVDLNDLDELKRICMEYDKTNGSYPENPWEGLAVFIFLRSKLTGDSYDSLDAKAFGDSLEEEWAAAANPSVAQELT